MLTAGPPAAPDKGGRRGATLPTMTVEPRSRSRWRMPPALPAPISMLMPVRQLLAIVEGADADAEVVSQALGIAAAGGGRVGFSALGRDRSRHRERLVKALAAAHALGVAAEAWAPVADAAAAVALARTRRCDLLVTASPAVAERSAQQGQPALVAASPGASAAIRVSAALLAEHRHQADVIHAALQQLADARRRHAGVDAAAMGVALAELRAAARHQAFEERALFPALRRRGHAWDAELDELPQQHRREAELLDALDRAMQGLQAPELRARIEATRVQLECLQTYAAFVWEHQGREEGVVLPAARRCLRDDAWVAIEAAWAVAAPADHAHARR